MHLAGLLLCLSLAVTTGLGATWYTTQHGVSFSTLRIGVWEAHPKNGSIDIDPYARAANARTGELPLGSGDGLAFLAERDSLGRTLAGGCEIVISGATPPARYWTLTLHDPEGRLVANPLGRYGFTSHELIRRADGGFEIVVALRARPGNWLPSGNASRHVVALRLYDSPIGASAHNRQDLTMPDVRLGACN